MRLLVSVRNLAEARIARAGGAGFIDLKEPRDGALGGLDVATIRQIVRALRDAGGEVPISATIGDRPMDDLAGILTQVAAVGACGVDYVKVGIERRPQARAVIDALASAGPAVVPVFIADEGVDLALVAHAGGLGFPALMIDTADKRVGSLFDVIDDETLRRFVAIVRDAGAWSGLAGALRLKHLPALVALAPDFAGFRSAVCAGDRASALDRGRLAGLVDAVQGLMMARA